MTEVQEQAVLIGDRQLMAYTDRAKTTVRDWHQRPFNPIPFTINEKGHRVFKIAEVDAWLGSRGGSDSGDSDIGLMRKEMHKLKDENRKLELQVSELKNTKTTTLDRVGQFLEARETVRGLMRESFPNATDKDLSQNDSAVLKFFDKVQSHLKLDADNTQTQNTMERSH